MRNLLIVLVLGVTALTFYSALWFKSENIEDDITARVTDELTSTGAEDIDVDVDGRHVTLTGVVYDEATEDAYLKTADSTYGALGPIDGLTFQADGGYVNAIKTADGIALRGTVPNEDVRAALVAEAQAATDGTVDDQLMIAGPEADWQNEATFGVGQLAGLTTGTLTAAAGTYALSGSTDADPDAITAGLSGREGWNAFISSPMEEQGLSAEVDRLTVEVADRDDRIGALEANVASLQADVGMRTGERDAVGVELADLRASLTEGQSDADDMRVQLDAATTMIGEKDQAIADLTGQVSDGTAQIATLEAELENRQAVLGNTDEQVVALTGKLDTANGVNADLTDQVSGRDVTIDGLMGGIADRDVTIDALTGDVADRDATIEGLNNQVAGLSANADQSVADLTEELAARDGTITELTAAVSERDASIDGLNSQLADVEGRLASADGEIADQNDTIDALNAQVADLDGSVATTAVQIAALTAATQSSDDDVAALEGQVADLTGVVAERDETITALRARPAASGNSAEQCALQATAALEGSRINFETGSAQIASGSVELLERLTGIALACVGDGLSVEIGGHTDAQGEEDSNQALSEARAQAVLAFMAERGVPTGGLEAVGYGESQPIADNDTSEGRAQNRRISFDWQAR